MLFNRYVCVFVLIMIAGRPSYAGSHLTLATELPEVSGFDYTAIPAGDVNGDGYDDVIIPTNDGLDVHLGSSSGVETSASASATYCDPESIYTAGAGAVGDVNGDGYADLGTIGAEYPGDGSVTLSVCLYLGGEDGLSEGFSALTDGAGGSIADPSYVALAHLGAGGKVSSGSSGYVRVAYANNFNELLYWEYAGGILSCSGFDDSPSCAWKSETSLAVISAVTGGADLDGNGYDDTVFAGSGEMQVLYGSTQATLNSDSLSLEYNPTDLGMADLDGDGFTDLIVPYLADDESGEGVAKVDVYFGDDEGGTWQGLREGSPSQIWSGSSTWYPWHVGSAGDTNGDGADDLLLVVSTGGVDDIQADTVLLYGSEDAGSVLGSGALPSVSDMLTDTRMARAAGDVNGDGYGDVIATETDGTTLIYHGHGADEAKEGTCEGGCATGRGGLAPYGALFAALFAWGRRRPRG